MTTTIDVLNRIANAIERTPEFPWAETGTGALILLFGGAILGIVSTHIAETKRAADRERRELEKQRKLLVSLLGDEIVLRWSQHIAKDFAEVLQGFSLKNVDTLCSTHFQPSDLYIFKQCAENLPFTTALQDNVVVSSVIHVHILSNDLCDGLCLLRNRYKEYEEAIALTKSRKIMSFITNFRRAFGIGRRGETKSQNNEIEDITTALSLVWENLQRIYKMMDTQILLIFARIGKEYETYVDNSCSKQDDTFPKDLILRIDCVAKKRRKNPICADRHFQTNLD